MLYERWCRIAAERSREVALRDLATGRRWTFAELHAIGESTSATGDILHPQGHTPEFVFTLLAAWRTGKVACPLEPGQTPPVVPLPLSPCLHLKATSATTGQPSWVAFTAAQLAADADDIVASMGLRPDWPNLGVISMAHSYGFSNLVLPLLIHGIPLILAPVPLPEVVRLAARAEPALTLAAVPALWRAWHEADAISPSVRLAISAGAPLPVELEQAVFQLRGLKIHNFYGSTECGGIAYDASNTPRTEEACVGSALRHVRLSLSDDGCLVIHSLAVGQSYWPEAADSLREGRFQTSDLVELREGNVFLRGRVSDQINVAGRKVSPAAIEQVLRQHDAVSGCLVFGVPSTDVDRGETIVACVELQSPIGADPLRRFLLERLPAWQVPREWWFVDSLRVNSRGKISRSHWRDEFLRHHERPRQAP